jgi:hypothetical protein
MKRTRKPIMARTRKPKPRYHIREDHVGGFVQNEWHGFTKRDPVFQILEVDHGKGLVHCHLNQARYTFYIKECKLV